MGVETGGLIMAKHYNMMVCLAVVSLAVTMVRAEEPVTEMDSEAPAAVEKIREGVGLGLIIGEPTGLSAKKWISAATAIDAAAAWSFVDFTSFQLHADFLWHNYDFVKTAELPGCLSVFYGIGGRIKLKGNNGGNGNKDEEDTRLGLRIPVGLSYVFKENPVELFAEVVPILDVVPETKFGVEVGIGARYYFNL